MTVGITHIMSYLVRYRLETNPLQGRHEYPRVQCTKNGHGPRKSGHGPAKSGHGPDPKNESDMVRVTILVVPPVSRVPKMDTVPKKVDRVPRGVLMCGCVRVTM